MRRLLFLFLPAVGLALIDLPHAPGMYPPEETNSNLGTVPPSAYMMSEPEQPYQFYYEKDPEPSAPGSAPSAPAAKTPERPADEEEPESNLGAAAGAAGPEGPQKGPSGPGAPGPKGPVKEKKPNSSGPAKTNNQPKAPVAPGPTEGPEADGEPLGYEPDTDEDTKWDNQKHSSKYESTDGEEGEDPEFTVALGPRKGGRPGKQPETDESQDSLAGENGGGYPGNAGGHVAARAKPSVGSGAGGQGAGPTTSHQTDRGSHGAGGNGVGASTPTTSHQTDRNHKAGGSGAGASTANNFDTDEEGFSHLYSGKETAGLRPKPQRTDLNEGTWSQTDTDGESGQSWSGAPPGHRAPELQVHPSTSGDGSEAYEKGGKLVTLPKGSQGRKDLGPNSSAWGIRGHGALPTLRGNGGHGGRPTLVKINMNVPRLGVITETDAEGPEDPEGTNGKPWSPDVNEIEEQVSKLVKLPVLKEPIRMEISKGSTERLSTWKSGENMSDGGKVCCPCCKDEEKLKEPVLGGGYVEASASPREVYPVLPSTTSGHQSQQVFPVLPASTNQQPVPIGQQQPTLLNPSPVLRPAVTGYGPSTAYTNLPGTFYPSAQQSPIIGQFTPLQYPQGGYPQGQYATSYGGSYGGGSCPCAAPPQICCQPVSPCCLPTLPCCPPPPPIPCCPQISLCCQPVIPCCLPQIQLPQICLPTIPLCFRGCPSCPCRRRRSVDDPRYKRAAFCQKRVKRHGNGNCRQCSSNANPLMQAAGGCGTCNGSHKRVKRLGCLPCGRKKREAEQEAQLIRQKRSCLPCPGGRKKRDASCRSCSLLQTFITRQKRTINCGPCGGRKKRSPDSCPCAAKAAAPGAAAPRMKRAVEEFDGPFTCDRNCCDYSRCAELRAKKLDLKKL